MRREIRRRWRGLIALTVLVALVGSVVLASAAGARRTSSALDRFREVSLSADVEMAMATPTPEQLTALRGIDGVVAIGELAAPGVQFPVVPNLQSVGYIVDDVFGVAIDRERIVAGRAPDPGAPDEIAIGEGLAESLHVGVGDHLEALSFTPDQIAMILAGNSDAGPYAGPTVRFRIVGISRRPLDLGLRGAAGGFLVLTPAFGRAYAGQIGQYGTRIRIRTDSGAANIDAIEARAREILGDSVISTQGLAVETEGASDAIDVLTLALLVFATVAAIAGAAAIGFVAMREISFASRDQPTLRALGLTRRQRVLAVVSVAMIAVGAGSLLAVLGALAASPLFPFGVARRADPDVGLHADWSVFALGAGGSLVVIGTVVTLVALRATAVAIAIPSATILRSRPSRVVDAVSTFGLSPTVTNGLRMAFNAGRGRQATPVRSAGAAAVIGLAGASAVLVFAASLDRVVTTPRLYGWNWDFNALDISPNTPCGDEDFGLIELTGIESVTELCYQNALVGGHPVTALAYRPLRGDAIEPVVIEGRAPQFDDEVALGSMTLRDTGSHIGDTITVLGQSASHDYRIVGRAVFPTLGQPLPLSDGIAFTGEGYSPLFDQNLFSRYFVGTFADDADRAAVEQRIASIPELADPAGPIVPEEIDRLDQIDWFPAALALLVSGLALYAVGHALVTSVRRRRGELAILKTLGFGSRQVRATIAWQATALAMFGVLIGVPLGLLVGVQVWRRVAASLGLALTSRVPVLPLVALMPVALLVVNLIVIVPARAAARLRPSAALRSE